MKKIIIAILVLLALCVGAILFVGRTYYPDNIAETSEDGGPKGLKTRQYESDVQTVTAASKEVVSGLSTWGGSWKIVDETEGGDKSGIKVEVPVVFFTDDLEVKIEDAAEGRVRVNVISQSRVGKSDFGENARHVNKFLSALDTAMNR